MKSGLRVGLLYGGRSVEHEVSVVSARGVAAAMAETELSCVPLAVTGEGRWLSAQQSAAILRSSAARVDAAAAREGGARVALEPAGGLVLLGADPPAQRVDIDVLFPLVHGWGGEDGRLQGALELSGVPYVGAGVLGSAAAMDKALAKVVFKAAGLPVVPWLTCSRRVYALAPRESLRKVDDELGYPVFVKPANGGSSVGVSRVSGPRQLPEAMEQAFECDGKLLVEAAVDAREIECAVLGNDDPQASVLGEIFPSREFYDYAAKYLDGTSRLSIPAEVDPSESDKIRRYALQAFEALDLCGFARVDFLVDRRSGQPFVNEVNTLPGFTPISMFPKLWEASGVSYPALIERLVRLARERFAAEGRRRSRWDQAPSGPA